MSQAITDRIATLRADVRRYEHYYYALEQPIVDDATYDAAYRELVELESSHPELVTPDSPTQRVGGAMSSGFASVRHLLPMLSLANARDEAELRGFDDRVRRLLAQAGVDTEPCYVTEPKIDGLAVSLTYRDGTFSLGSTRGDGEVGEDVTANLRTLRSLPLRMIDEAPPSLLEVRGEVYIPLAAFSRMNDERIARGLPVYMNPRNTAAGSLRQLDPVQTATRPLSVWCYGVGAVEGIDFESHHESLQWLAARGFPVNPLVRLHETIDEVVRECAAIGTLRADLPYDIDGVVVKLDQRALHQVLGSVGRDPRWAVAFKFPATTRTTRLLDIQINVGRTGALNPFAILEPVEVGGVIVKLATLHNEDDIRRKDIRVGDTVIVQRAGDVIPQVVGPVPELRPAGTVEFSMPSTCPLCGTAVEQAGGEVKHRCPNRNCPSRGLEGLKHFVSRGAMDIEGVGEKLVARLWDLGLVRRPGDLYRLTTDQLLVLDGFKERSAANVVDAIEASKERPFSNVLFGLGIRHVGDVTSLVLARAFGSIDALMAASVEEVSAVEGIGPVIGSAVVEWFADEDNRAAVEELRAAGVRLSADLEAAAAPAGTALDGLTFVITGTLSRPRAEFENLIAANGGKVVSSVSKKTSYLLAGGEAGSKLAKATELGIPVLGEAGLAALIASS